MNPPYKYAAPETRPARRSNDHYPTPAWVIEAALDLVQSTPYWVMDAGAGEGQWGVMAQERWPDAQFCGVEIRDIRIPVPYDLWVQGDFCEMDWQDIDGPQDLVIGNPPYSHAEPFIRKSLDLLREGGELVFLLRLQFLCGQARAKGLYRAHPPADIAFCSKRVSFYGEGKTGSEDYCVLRWCKGWHGETRVHWIGANK